MDKKRIVITGVGVVAPNGIGKEAFWQALKEGKSGIKAITRFDTNQFKTKLAGEIDNFVPENYLGQKGLRALDRSTRFICSAAKMALDDANLVITDDNTDDIGVCTGTTLSSLWSMAEFDRQVIQDGPLFTDVALFPHTVINAASSYISILNNIQGVNTTISNSYSSGLDALKYAIHLIETNKVKAVIVGGVESLSQANFTGFYLMGLLAGIKGEEVSCPFDKRANGFILSEGASVIILEDEEYARKRNAHIYAEIKGLACIFNARKIGKFLPADKGLHQSIMNTMAQAGMSSQDISYISASANSTPQQDLFEIHNLKNIFKSDLQRIPVTALKSLIGETFSPAGIFQIIAGIGNILYNFLTPTINYCIPQHKDQIDHVPNKMRTSKIHNILINNFGPGGNFTSCIISNYK